MKHKHLLPRLPQNATAADAIAWTREITKTIGLGFHPDTAGVDYVHIESGERSFNDRVAHQLDVDVSRTSALLESAGREIYSVAIKVQRRMLSGIA